tara:strand:+ start:1677 stop:1799 length:123 start_codon:yes stop_codon:yes gene_type:complete
VVIEGSSKKMIQQDFMAAAAKSEKMKDKETKKTGYRRAYG